MNIKTTTYPVCIKTGKVREPKKHLTHKGVTKEGLLNVLTPEQYKTLVEDGRVWKEYRFPNVLHFFELYEVVE